MQFKKRYVVVVVLLLLGLTTFTFASPRQVEKQKTSKGISERVSNDKKENKSYAEALQAVEDAEENPTLDTVETARNEIRNADDATVEQINQLEQRVEVVEETIDVAALVKEVETLAEVKETRDDAKAKYPNAETEVNKLAEGDVKDNLVSRLAKVSRLLNDTDAPVVTGIDENVPTNKNEIVYVNDEFLTSVTIDGKEYTEFTADGDILKFEKKITTEGTHTVTAIDKLGNETTKTFTIDKTAAKKNAVNANVNGYKNEVKEQYATNGNTVTAYISINEELKYNPTFTFYANGKEIKVIAKEDVIARSSSNAKYPYVYEVKLAIDENLEAEDGELTFTVTDIVDKAGNKTADITKVSNGKVVKLDRTPNRVTFTTISTDNKTVEGKVYYVTAGDTVTFRIGVREKFSENPVVTIGGKEVTLEYVKYFKEPNHHEYKGTLKLDDTLIDGPLAITISNLTDEVGNKGFYYQTNGKKVLETITKPETTNGKSLVYDNTAPVNSYVAILSKGNNYLYAKNGDTIRFLVAFNEEVKLSDDFAITFNGKTKKLSRSGDKTKYEYIAEFKIPADEAELKEGLLTFEVKGFADKLGNLSSEVLTNATHTKYNKVTYDRTAPGLTIKTESIGVDPYYSEISYKLTDNNLIDYYEINGKKVDVTNSKWGDANYSNIKSKLVTGKNTITLYDVAGNKTVKEFNIAKNTAKVEEGKVTITEDVNLVNEPIYNDIETEEEMVINGNGKTVTQYITSVDELQWKGNHKTPNGLNIPLLGNVFSSKNGAKVTVNDITFTGTIHSILLGNYEDSNSDWFNTEFNNVNIVNTKVVSFSAGIAPAAVIYGKATLNNVNITGTTRSELENSPTDPYWPIYDLAAVNGSNTTINGGKIGSIYLWAKAIMTIKDAEVDVIDTLTTTGHLEIASGSKVNRINMNGTNKYKPDVTIKSGATVKVLDLSKVTNFTDIIIEDGAIVETVITTDGEMSYEAWVHGIETPEELKSKLSSGEDIILKKDITLIDEPLVIAKDKEVEIDLNGKTITGRSTNASASKLITVNEGATLKLTGEGTIDFTAGKPDTNWGGVGQLPFPGYSSNTISNNGKLIIDGPTLINNTARGGASYVIDNYQGSELIVKSGKIHQTGGDQAIRIFANSNTLTTSLTVEGGEIIGRRALWIQLPNSAADRAPKVNVNITGGTLKSNDTAEGGYNIAIYSYSYGESFKNVNVNISGGEFFGHVAFGGGAKNGKENVNVTGGVFHNDLGRYLADDGWEDIAKPAN